LAKFERSVFDKPKYAEIRPTIGSNKYATFNFLGCRKYKGSITIAE
jgi:16S rRNA G966 N2-methylase RsmD